MPATDTSVVSVRSRAGIPRRATVPALILALTYLAVSVLWILLSDPAVNAIVAAVSDPAADAAQRVALQTRLQTGKGIAFMLVTALLLFFLVRSYLLSLLRTQRAASSALEKSAADFRLLFQNNPLPMWTVDPKALAITSVNTMALGLFGYTREEFLSLTILDLVAPAERQRLVEFAASFPGAQSTTTTWRSVRKDGSALDMEVTGHSLLLDGKPARLVVALDVTQKLVAQRALENYRRELEARVTERTEDLSRTNRMLTDEIARRQLIEAQLREAKAIAEAASAAKSSFLARTTHEIRLPLSSVLGYADLILESRPGEADCRRHAAVIRQNASRLLTLIEDLLDLSRIEAHRLPVRLAGASPRALLEEVVDLFRPQVDADRVALSLDVASDVPATLRTDPARFRQILVNLVGNALKFTADGAVVVTAAAIDGRLVVSVRDTGPGIPPERLGKLFTPFYQASDDPDAPRGTGLGLAISRQLAELLGGTVSAANVAPPDHGSVFTLALPLHPAEITAPAPSAAAAPLHLSILIAEDDTHIRWLVARFLESAGATVAAVASGLDAVAAARQAHDAGRPFELVVLDMHMPGLNGPETARAIREITARVPIIGLTASSDRADTEALLAAGCNAVAHKPIDRKGFLALLRSHTR